MKQAHSATVSVSPNHGDRRGTNRPDLIVIHYTGMADAASARDRLCAPDAEVSAHWLIDTDGSVEALVAEDRRAWHAGAGSWMGRGDVNSHSIGIELVNPGDHPFPEPQISALEALLSEIVQRWEIPAYRIIGHSDMAPGRKIDPGPKFDWARLARQGFGLAWTAGQPRTDFQQLLDSIGYPQAEPADRLSAFRLHFCPWNRGPENELDRQTAAGVFAETIKQTEGKMLIYKVLRPDEWVSLEASGQTDGAPIDLADGYIHFSTAEQLPETLSKHFAAEDNLKLLACDADQLASDLKWEPSRHGQLFPHLYRPLRMGDVQSVRTIHLTPQGHDLRQL